MAKKAINKFFPARRFLNMLFNFFVHIISKLLAIDQMRIGWIRRNLVGEKNLTVKIFSKQFPGALIKSILSIFIIIMKTPGNSKM